ncbi:MAG: hypothetical protein H0T53_13655 [Herpetosiphonaceae bacterium]|nr:hypothetical protein [Herpetosiphonaceae bacterium]
MIGSDARNCPACGDMLRSTALFCPKCGTAVLPSVSNALQVSLGQILNSVKPGQAEVMRRCAIPRWFDSEILGVLRDRQDGANEKILAQLETYSFVRQLSNGRYSYSDDVRDLLLDDWRQRPDDLRPIQKRLYNYFERRMGSTTSENRATWLREIVTYDLLLASTTLVKDQQESENPWIITPSAVAARVERAILRFRSLFESAFNAHRMAEAEAILIAAEEQVNILAPTIRQWLEYYRGKMNHASLRLPEAIACYQQLLKQNNLDTELKALSSISLGDVQVENGSWSAAINSYQAALDLPKLEPGQRAAAHLGIGDAYNEIAISSGGWHIASQPQNPLVRTLRNWVLALGTVPMFILVTLLRRAGAAVPPAAILVRYQNWMLARIFRASREEVLAAYAIYKERNDQSNMARCEMRLVDNDVLFSSIKQAVILAQDLLDHTKPENTYRRARVQVTLARALLADRQYAAAQQEVEAALKVFCAVDDGRWETRALSVLGHIHVSKQQPEPALDAYRQGLERAVQIGSVLSRERILYELRVWRRTRADYPPAIDTLLDTASSQRFVNRFPRFLVPYLQIGQSVVVPILVLLTSIVAPNLQPPTVIRTTSNILLPAPTVYTFPWERLIISPLLVLLIAALGYTLLGLVVLWRMPLKQLRQNQPDIYVIHADELVHYDHQGHEAHRIKWSDITTIATADRKLWIRPLPVFSRSIIESKNQPVLRVEGIISWYNTACRIIQERTQAAGAAFSNVDLSFSLLRSRSGIVLITGATLLAVMVASINQWVPDLAALLPASVFAALQLLAYSGVLMIGPMLFWLVIRPLRLRHEFALDRRIPKIIAGVGLAIVLLFIVTNGSIVRVPILSITLFLAGLFLVTETGYQLSVQERQGRRTLVMRSIFQMVMFAVGLMVVVGPIKREFYHARAHAYTVQSNPNAAKDDRVLEAEQSTLFFSNQMDLEIAIAKTDARAWSEADQEYTAIINDPTYDPFTQTLARHNQAQSDFLRCRNTQTCSAAEYARIIAQADRVLEQIRDPQAQSAAYETQADAYGALNDDAKALEKLLRARELTTDAEQIRQLDIKINDRKR